MNNFFAIVMIDNEYSRVWLSEPQVIKILDTDPTAVIIRTDVNMMASAEYDRVTWTTVPDVSPEETIKHATESAVEYCDPTHIL